MDIPFLLHEHGYQEQRSRRNQAGKQSADTLLHYRQNDGNKKTEDTFNKQEDA